MRRHLLRVAVPFVFLFAASACASQAMELSTKPGMAPGTTQTSNPAAPIAIVATDDGLAGVPIGSNRPQWSVPRAVAAPDGSAIYAADNDATGTDAMTTRLWRIDPKTGAMTSAGEWADPAGQPAEVFAVEPGGRRVALASFDGTHTLIVAFDPATGGAAKASFDGHLEPEAFSTDRKRMFAARSYGDHYRITTLDLTTATQEPTGRYDKTSPPEDMYGNVIQAVLTPGAARLATLYRDPHSTDHTAFVHLLDLTTGITVCIDLPAPFGTGHATDALRANNDGTIDVGHRTPGTSIGMTASINPNTILTGPPQTHYHADPHPDSAPPAIPDDIAGTPHFTRFVATAS